MQLGSFIRNSPSDSVEGSENHHLRWMDPIDISSSDSDLEIEESIPREGVSGILPAWASGSKTNSGAGWTYFQIVKDFLGVLETRFTANHGSGL